MDHPQIGIGRAALLARLLNHVTCNLRGTINLDETVYAWTDSRIVLCWLQTSVHTLEVFVANRVSQITGSETPLVWRHVPGEWNPADCASRGCRAPDLLLDKLLGVTGWIKRFVNNCRKPQAERNFTPVLSPAERNAALCSLVRVVQAEHFEEEVGQAAAEQINNLITGGLLADKLHLIGHSLGSHVAGYTARELKNKYNKTVKRLTALDPAFPAFYPNGIVMDHVSSSDAEFVDVIHTDAGGYGAPVRTGTVDFWPNGGNSVQPGCPRFAPIPLSDDSSSHIEIGVVAEEKQDDTQITVTTVTSRDVAPLDIEKGPSKQPNETRGSNGQTCSVARNVAFVRAFRKSWKDGDLCSHWRSWRFYAESVRNPEAFPASPAASYQKFLDNLTPETGMVYMGYNCDTSAEGSYYLTTNGQSPFGKGIDGLYPKRKKSKK
ncbi:lipase domain-containing protein [Phthorimaea operculella]|nr:lipase domain-containing protein [Phthorimaea operculella]